LQFPLKRLLVKSPHQHLLQLPLVAQALTQDLAHVLKLPGMDTRAPITEELAQNMSVIKTEIGMG
jgi:hypothetical protein